MSLEVLTGARLEEEIAAEITFGVLKGAVKPVQFERLGYFCLDKDSGFAGLVFNRTIGLRDTYAKIYAK